MTKRNTTAPVHVGLRAVLVRYPPLPLSSSGEEDEEDEEDEEEEGEEVEEEAQELDKDLD